MRAMLRGDTLYSFCCCSTNWRMSEGSDVNRSRVAAAVGMLMNRKGAERRVPVVAPADEDDADEDEDEDDADEDEDKDVSPSSAISASRASRRVKNTSSESQEK
jgi:hypothetical protein